MATGQGTLYARITYLSQRAGSDFTTGLALNAVHWDAKKQKAKGPMGMHLNHQICQVQTKLTGCFAALQNAGQPFTANDIKAAYLGKISRLSSLLELVGEKLARDICKCPSELAQSSVDTRKRYVRKLAMFLAARKLTQILPAAFSQAICQDLYTWAAANGYTGHNTIAKLFSYIRGALRHARNDGNCGASPIDNFRLATHPKPLFYLSVADLQRMAMLNLVDRLERIRDLFLLSSFTGFSYAELAQFDRAKHITQYLNRDLIVIERTKSTKAKPLVCEVPLLPAARKIFEKYNYCPPVPTNQKYNAYLKEIQALLGLNFELTSHVARKTFAMYLLEQGVSADSVAAMLGHRGTAMLFKAYGRISAKRLFTEIDLLKLSGSSAIHLGIA